MSCTPGKVEVTGVQEINGVPAFVLRFLQCRDDAWMGVHADSDSVPSPCMTLDGH